MPNNRMLNPSRKSVHTPVHKMHSLQRPLPRYLQQLSQEKDNHRRGEEEKRGCKTPERKQEMNIGSDT